MDVEKDEYFPVAAGPVTLGIRFADKGNRESFARYFADATREAVPDIYIDFTVIEHEDYPDIPESLIQAKKWNDGFFSIADNLFHGRYNEEDKRWEVTVKHIMTMGQITRVFEQFLYQAFYSACATSGSEAFLIHSSGVTAGDRGFLFVGASGMGKSTISEMSRQYGVLNDEMNIVSPSDAGFNLNPSPFNAYFKDKAQKTVPLRAVFLLRHDTSCRLEKVSPARACAEITGQVVPPLGLEDTFTPAVASTMMATAMKLSTAVPVFLLYFPVEGGFWPLIMEKFPNNES